MSKQYMPWSWGVRYQYEEYNENDELIDFSIEEETVFDNYKEAWEYFNEKITEANIAHVVLAVYRGGEDEGKIMCAFSMEWEDTIQISWG